MTISIKHRKSQPTRSSRDRQFAPTIPVWLLHWLSALLVIYLLATSLASGLGFSKRPFPTIWMDWHFSVGVALLGITTLRLWTSSPRKFLTTASSRGSLNVSAIKAILLYLVFVGAASGLAIFQKAPLGRSSYLFGLYPMPTLVRLGHSLHNIIIDFHIVLACIIAGLMVKHVTVGLRRAPQASMSPFISMLWPRRNKG